MSRPNEFKDAGVYEYIDLINTKFADYDRCYRRQFDSPVRYLVNMWRNSCGDCDFWDMVLHHYKIHRWGPKKYYDMEKRKASRIIYKFIRAVMPIDEIQWVNE